MKTGTCVKSKGDRQLASLERMNTRLSLKLFSTNTFPRVNKSPRRKSEKSFCQPIIMRSGTPLSQVLKFQRVPTQSKMWQMSTLILCVGIIPEKMAKKPQVFGMIRMLFRNSRNIFKKTAITSHLAILTLKKWVSKKVTKMSMDKSWMRADLDYSALSRMNAR